MIPIFDHSRAHSRGKEGGGRKEEKAMSISHLEVVKKPEQTPAPEQNVGAIDCHAGCERHQNRKQVPWRPRPQVERRRFCVGAENTPQAECARGNGNRSCCF